MKGDMQATGPLTEEAEPSDRRLVALHEEDEDGGAKRDPGKKTRKKRKGDSMYKQSDWRVYSSRDLSSRKRWLKKWEDRVGRVEGENVVRDAEAVTHGSGEGDGDGAGDASNGGDSRAIREELEASRAGAGVRMYGRSGSVTADVLGAIEEDTPGTGAEQQRGFDFSRIPIPKAKRLPGCRVAVGMYCDDTDSTDSSPRSSGDGTQEDWRDVAHFPLTLKPKVQVPVPARPKHVSADRDRASSSTPPSSRPRSWPETEHSHPRSLSTTPPSSRSSGLTSHDSTGVHSEYALRRRARNPRHRHSVPLDEHALLFSPALVHKAERPFSPFSTSDFYYEQGPSGKRRRMLQQTRKAIVEARIAFYPTEEKERRLSGSATHSDASRHSGTRTPWQAEQQRPKLGHGHGRGRERSNSLPNPARIVPTSPIGLVIGQEEQSGQRTSSLTSVTRPSSGVDMRPAGWKHIHSEPAGTAFELEAPNSSTGYAQQLPANHKQTYLKTRVDTIESRTAAGGNASQTVIGFPFRMHSPPLVKRKALPPRTVVSDNSAGPVILTGLPQAPHTYRDKGKGKARVDSGQYEIGSNPGDERNEYARGDGDDAVPKPGDEETREVIRTALDLARKTLWPDLEPEAEPELQLEHQGSGHGNGGGYGGASGSGNSNGSKHRSRSRSSGRTRSLLVRDVGTKDRADWNYQE